MKLVSTNDPPKRALVRTERAIAKATDDDDALRELERELSVSMDPPGRKPANAAAPAKTSNCKTAAPARTAKRPRRKKAAAPAAPAAKALSKPARQLPPVGRPRDPLPDLDKAAIDRQMREPQSGPYEVPPFVPADCTATFQAYCAELYQMRGAVLQTDLEQLGAAVVCLRAAVQARALADKAFADSDASSYTRLSSIARSETTQHSIILQRVGLTGRDRSKKLAQSAAAVLGTKKSRWAKLYDD